MLKDPIRVRDEIIAWIREYFEKNGKGCYAVLGLSGGKDSTVAAALCAQALGKDRVVGVLMPNGVQADIGDSRAVARLLGIHAAEINIGPAVEASLEMLKASVRAGELPGATEISRDTVINLQPRIRMTVLYGVGQSLPGGARVVNTCNRSEDYIGYSTKFGDAAGDFSPLCNLLVHEVIQVGEALGLPDYLIKKTPSDGLSGQTDEDKIGFTYAVLDHYVLTGECPDEETRRRIDRLHAINLHKLLPMPSFHLSE